MVSAVVVSSGAVVCSVVVVSLSASFAVVTVVYSLTADVVAVGAELPHAESARISADTDNNVDVFFIFISSCIELAFRLTSTV